MLLTIGDLLEELLVQLPSEPPRGETTHVRSARVRGGSAANVAALTSERGGRSRFVGRVGADSIGQTLAADLRARGVDTRVRYSGGTGVIVSLIGGGERTHLVDRGASRRLESLDPDVLDDVTQIFVPGAVLTSDPIASVAQTLITDAAEARIPVFLGCLSETDLTTYGVAAFRSFVERLRPDALISNRTEHAALGLAPDMPAAGAAVTVVTNRAEPTRVMNDRGLLREVTVRPVEPIRDRTGAGDGFIAGFLEAHRAGADAVAAVDAGHRVAALVLGQLGPTTGVRR